MRITISIAVLLVLAALFGCAESQKQRSAQEMQAEDIARLTIYAYNGESETENLIACYGHAFLSMENISDRAIYVYNYELQPGEEQTFSWWAVDAHMGVWFGLEDSYIDLYGRYVERYSTDIYINKNELETINRYIAENDYYTPRSNCAKMVTGCWNSAAEESARLPEYLLATPSALCEDIQTFERFQFGRDINTNGEICYYDAQTQSFCSYSMEVSA